MSTTRTATIRISEESRNWGYNPAPDGTVVELLRPGTVSYGRTHNFGKDPGVFTNDAWWDVRLPDGSEIHISASYLEGDTSAPSEKISDLPETPFWEWDTVLYKGSSYQVEALRFHEAFISYDLRKSPRCGTLIGIPAEDLALLQRGPVWKLLHEGEKPTFDNLKKEAAFYREIGYTEQVRNPATGFFSFSYVESLQTILEGAADALGVGGLFSQTLPTDPYERSTSHSLYRFLDREVGERVRAATLKGFAGPIAELLPPKQESYDPPWLQEIRERQAVSKEP